ncbi:2OG-Fe(II) oxygenase family protein [Burkholderia sp. 3C]
MTILEHLDPQPDAACRSAPDRDAQAAVLGDLPDLCDLRLDALPERPMARASLVQQALRFDDPGGFGLACESGFFLLRIPEGLDLAPTDRLCANFFTPHAGDASDAGNAYRGFRSLVLDDGYQGYFDRPHDQLESLFVSDTGWHAHLPPEVAATGRRMASIADDILRCVLRGIGVSEGEMARVTGGAADGAGHHMLGFNHYRPEKAMRGSKFHRDGSWVTLLRSTEPGLVALIDGELFAIHADPGYLIVNFGRVMEVLTEGLARPVRASIHGVTRTAGEGAGRTSYTMCNYSRIDADVYGYEAGRAVRRQSMREYVAQQAQRSYDDLNAL